MQESCSCPQGLLVIILTSQRLLMA